MAEKRKSGKDWRKTYQNAKTKVEKIEADIRERLRFLIKEHPDAIIGCSADIERTPFKAKSLDTARYLDNMEIDTVIRYVKIIESWLADQHPHQQQNLF